MVYMGNTGCTQYFICRKCDFISVYFLFTRSRIATFSHCTNSFIYSSTVSYLIFILFPLSAFVEYQTEITDLTHDVDQFITPYLDFPHYAMRVLYPGLLSHPILEANVNISELFWMLNDWSKSLQQLSICSLTASILVFRENLIFYIRR